jgi:hypothetical protein
MFIATICWSICLLWLTVEYVKKQSWNYALSISFAAYSLLMTGYPQFIIMCGYIIFINLLACIVQNTILIKKKILIFTTFFLLIISGIVMALPAYIDVFVNAKRSARLAVSDDFFVRVLPKIQNGKEFLAFLGSIIDPFWFGNPIQQNTVLKFDGLSPSIFYFVLLFLSFSIFRHIAKLWYWKVLIIFCFAGTALPPVYLFAVHHLGFNLSRSQMLGGALIPSFILVADTIDRLLRDREASQFRKEVILCITPCLFVSISQLYLAYTNSWKINLGYMVMHWLFMLGIIAFLATRHSFILLTLASLCIYTYSLPLTLFRPINKIQTSSELIRLIQTHTSGNTRFSSLESETIGIIPPNQEALLNIRSIHSYDSLSSRNYQKIVTTWSKGETITYGRLFFGLSDLAKVAEPNFRLSGVSLLMTKQTIDSPVMTKVAEVNGIKLYKILQKPLLRFQTSSFSFFGKESVVLDLDQKPLQHEVDLIEEFDDYLRIRVSPLTGQTVLFLSQQFHPYWQARADDQLLETVLVNEFYQGVMLPPNTNEVTLEFKPFVLWSWAPQVIYSGFLLLLVYRALKLKAVQNHLVI